MTDANLFFGRSWVTEHKFASQPIAMLITTSQAPTSYLEDDTVVEAMCLALGERNMQTSCEA